MDSLQGSILRVKLRHLQSWTHARRGIASLYDKLLCDGGVTTPCKIIYGYHVYHLYVVRTTSRDTLQQVLLNEGIQTGIHYPIPVHLQPCYVDLGH